MADVLTPSLDAREPGAALAAVHADLGEPPGPVLLLGAVAIRAAIADAAVRNVDGIWVTAIPCICASILGKAERGEEQAGDEGEATEGRHVLGFIVIGSRPARLQIRWPA